MNELYYYNGEPLELSYSNGYSMADKIEIVMQLEEDYSKGMLSLDQMRWIILEKRFGSYTCQRIIDKLMFNKQLKYNPITNNTRNFNTIKKPFDL
mgnify:CR=1 FL=1|tara:strand:- start:50 stop:334 length:285 start_codon:yes stop_codon:yes gene_type:complete